jgi:hypothetical protein
VKALCVRVADGGDRDAWLTLNREYQVLSVLMTPKGPAKLRIIADDGRTPILADASLFAMSSQPVSPTWSLVIREGGVVEFGPSSWLEPGFWERYFDRDAGAVSEFEEQIIRMTPKQ